MSEAEARAFESNSLCADIPRLRRWDEAAKVPGRLVDLAWIEALAMRVLAAG